MRNAARRSRGGTNGVAIPWQDLREKADTSNREYEPLAQRVTVGIRKPRNNNATRRSEMYAVIDSTSKQAEYSRMTNFAPPRKSQNPITAGYISTRRADFPVTIPHGTYRHSGGGSRGSLNFYANAAVGKIVDGTRRDGIPGNVITPKVKQTDVSKQQVFGEDSHRDQSEYDINHRTYDLASYLTARGNYRAVPKASQNYILKDRGIGLILDDDTKRIGIDKDLTPSLAVNQSGTYKGIGWSGI